MAETIGIIAGIASILGVLFAVWQHFANKRKEKTPSIPTSTLSPNNLPSQEINMKDVDVTGDQATAQGAGRDINIDQSKKTIIEKQIILSEKEPSKSSSEVIVRPPTSFIAHPYPMQENFTGRDEERKMLSEWFEQDDKPMLAVIAIGGMGKSSLAWKWVQDDVIGKEKVPDGLIWWSFYDKDSGLESFVNRSLEYASGGEIKAQDITSIREKMDKLYQILREKRFLLVLDGVERLLRHYAQVDASMRGDDYPEDDKEQNYRECADIQAGRFLQTLASVNSKTLITSRLPPKELDRLDGCLSYPLDKLSKEDTVKLFKKEKIIGIRSEIERVCERLGYHPLSLRVMIGLLKEDDEYKGEIKFADQIDIIRDTQDSDLKEAEKLARLLIFVYDRLPKEERELLCRFSAFRGPQKYENLLVFNEADSKSFKKIIKNLKLRKLLFYDDKSKEYDLHPLIRKNSYEHLNNKKATHDKLRQYYLQNIPEAPQDYSEIESLAELSPIIELYHHTLKTGDYDKACLLFYERLSKPLYYTFGAYQLRIELLLGLFPDGGDKLPCLKDKSYQGWAMNALGATYGRSGLPIRSVFIRKKALKLAEELGEVENQAVGLANLATDQMDLGELDEAEANLQRRIQICREISDNAFEAVGRQELGRLLAYKGDWSVAEKELKISHEILVEQKHFQSLRVNWAYRSLMVLMQQDFSKALEAAQETRKLANVKHFERDIIWTEWVLGAAYRGLSESGTKDTQTEHLEKAEKHTHEAHTRCRQINLVDVEADILLELARIRRLQSVAAPFMGLDGKPDESLMNQADTLASDALKIADRCEYRLQQADIRLFLAQLALDEDDKAKARAEAEIAEERASCGYKPTLDKAQQFLSRL